MTHRETAAAPTGPRVDIRALLATRGIDIEARERQAEADVRAGRRKPPRDVPKPAPAPPPRRSKTTPVRDSYRRWLDDASRN